MKIIKVAIKALIVSVQMRLMSSCVGIGDVLVSGVGGAAVGSQGGQILSLQKIPNSLLPN